MSNVNLENVKHLHKAMPTNCDTMILKHNLSASRLRAESSASFKEQTSTSCTPRDFQCFTKLKCCWVFGDGWTSQPQAVLAQHDFSLWNTVEPEEMMKETWLGSLITAIKQRVFNWVESYKLFKQNDGQRRQAFISFAMNYFSFINMKEVQLLSQHAKHIVDYPQGRRVARWTLRSNATQHETLRVGERNVCATLASHPRKWFRFRLQAAWLWSRHNIIQSDASISARKSTRSLPEGFKIVKLKFWSKTIVNWASGDQFTSNCATFGEFMCIGPPTRHMK